ncbi:NTP transferase domain-containing protein [bacterium]|nr:NTP transferase domain-containing protein [bacterium]
MKKVAILQARLDSSRFPGKVLADLKGRPVIAHIIDRLKSSSELDEVCVAIPSEHKEDKLAEALAAMDVTVVRGHASDVLARYIQAAYETKADIVVRATGDNPLVATEVIDQQVSMLAGEPELDYVITEGMSVGLTTETFTLKTLEKLDFLAKHPDHREHVTLYLRRNPGPFVMRRLDPPAELANANYRLTLDTEEDYKVLSAIYDKLYGGNTIQLKDVFKLLEDDSELNLAARQQVSLAAG